MIYNRDAAVRYALRYALIPNPAYAYFDGSDCTNFISQCLHAGGASYDYDRSHPWWYASGRASVCWAVAHSLFWYIRQCTAEDRGIVARTLYLDDADAYFTRIGGKIELGDLIQYRNAMGDIRHSTMITGFDGSGEPLVSQHTFEGRNVSWRKPFPQAIFHHIIRITR